MSEPVTAEAPQAAGVAGASDASPQVRKNVYPTTFASYWITLPDLILTAGRLSASRTAGVDGLPITAVRSCLPAVGPLITHVINSSISTATFPAPGELPLSSDPEVWRP